MAVKGHTMDASSSHQDFTALGHWLSPAGILAAIAGIAGLVPTLIAVFAGLAAGVFYTVQVLETKTVSTWLATRRDRRKLSRIAYLQYRHGLITAQMRKLGVLTDAELHITEGVQTTRTAISLPTAMVPPDGKDL
jgi:hypothetical protein